MKTKLSVIVDNIACGELAGEWGLSIVAEFRGRKILIDAGSSDLFAANMKAMGFEINEIDYAVLSHAHYDHANGLPCFLKANNSAKCYIRETTSDNCYHWKSSVDCKYIGIPKNMLTDFADRITIVSGDYEVMPGAYLIPHKTPNLDQLGKREQMYLKTSSGWKFDNFSHEQSLVLDTDKGLVIINCCSHGGVVNIINEIASTFPDKHVYGMIGGFHLFNKTEAEVRNVAKLIKDTGISFVCTGHCTGETAYQIMKEELGDTLEQLHVGLVMTF